MCAKSSLWRCSQAAMSIRSCFPAWWRRGNPVRRRIAGVLGLAVLLLAAGVAQAQKFPARAIQFVVPLAAGSTTDVAARMIAQRVAQTLDAQIIVENRPGSSTMLGSAMVAKAEPDGHTLLMGASSLAVNQNLFKTVPYDTEKDFTPITLLVTAPMVLVVNPALGVKTLGEFLAKFRSVPNVTFASPGAGNVASPRRRGVQTQDRHGRAAGGLSRRRA